MKQKAYKRRVPSCSRHKRHANISSTEICSSVTEAWGMWSSFRCDVVPWLCTVFMNYGLVIKSMLFSWVCLQDTVYLCWYVSTILCGGGRGSCICTYYVCILNAYFVLRSHILHIFYTEQLSPVSSRTSPLFPCLALKGREAAGNVPRTINHRLFCEPLRFLLGVVMAHWGSGRGSAPCNLSIDSVS